MAAPERPDLVAKQELEFQRDAVLKTLELLGTEKNSWYKDAIGKMNEIEIPDRKTIRKLKYYERIKCKRGH